jgi:hypothetical protein
MAQRWRMVLALVGVAAALAGCVRDPVPPPQEDRPPQTLAPAFAGAAVLPQPDMTFDGPGSLVEVKPLASNVDFEQANATAVRVVYRSTSGTDGGPTEVSGVVVVPAGKPPRGGWPIISFGHNATGVDNKCAPSLAGDLVGYASVITVLLGRGYVVAMSDYQGLGVAGYQHSLLDAPTLGNNMIDAVRAARRVLGPLTSTSWAAFGGGQGGLAAWAASERASSYGGGLDMAGAVALSPFADMSDFADAAGNGTLRREQYWLQIRLLQSLAATRPSFDLDNYRSGLAKDRWVLLTDCAPADTADFVQTANRLQPSDLKIRDDAATAQMRSALAELAMPQPSQTPPAAPILVVFATDDTEISAKSVDRALTRACAQGEPVVINRRVGDTTTSLDWVIQSSLDWLQGRFGGERVADICFGVA